MSTSFPPELFTVAEVAHVAGATADDVRAVAELGESPPTRLRYLTFDEAVFLVRALRALRQGEVLPRRIFAAPLQTGRTVRLPLATSGALHAAALAAFVLVASLTARGTPTEARVTDTPRLVFLSAPGPGGGGGGGGLQQPRPAPPAQVRGTSNLRSPVTVARRDSDPEKRVEAAPPPVVPEPARTPEPPTPEAQPTPPVVAPVATAPSDAADRAGVIEESQEATPAHDAGVGGGTGTGRGSGIGEGHGAGIGDGSGAGFGGGPYRPGAGITPPALVREVKPVYTEEGRRRGVEGEVGLEVVIRADGGVGAIRVLRGLGSGLDQRAIDAVRQWTFMPARRHGTPVDVLVEVAVEFRMR